MGILHKWVLLILDAPETMICIPLAKLTLLQIQVASRMVFKIIALKIVTKIVRKIVTTRGEKSNGWGKKSNGCREPGLGCLAPCVGSRVRDARVPGARRARCRSLWCPRQAKCLATGGSRKKPHTRKLYSRLGALQTQSLADF